jgi:hypothetical protein
MTMARSNDGFTHDEPPFASSGGAVTRSRHVEVSGMPATNERQTRLASNGAVGPTSPHSSLEDSQNSEKNPWTRYGDDIENGQELPSGKCFVVGIDYGATFSGVCLAFVDHADFRRQTLPESLINKAVILNNYTDSAEYDVHFAVPTILAYDQSSLDTVPVRWGFPCCQTRKASNVKNVQLAKFLFSSQHDDLPMVKSLRSLVKKLGKQPCDFAADFLMQLKAKVDEEISVAYSDYVNAPRYYYCGVPAGWSQEKAMMADACHRAELWGAVLVSESEAAANALLSNRSDLLVVCIGNLTAEELC